MAKIIQFLLLSVAIFSLGSCVPKQPYEIKSPCVSADSENPWARNPCSWKSLNRGNFIL